MAVLTTLLVIFTPPLKSIKKTAISLITFDWTTQSAPTADPINPASVSTLKQNFSVKNQPDPARIKTDEKTTVKSAVVESDIQETTSADSARDRNYPAALPGEKTILMADSKRVDKPSATDKTAVVESLPAEFDSYTTTANLKYFRSHPDVVFHQAKNLAADTGQIDRVSDRNKTDESGEPPVESDKKKTSSDTLEIAQIHPDAPSSEIRDLTANAEKTERVSDADEKASVMRPTVESDVPETPVADLKYFRNHPDVVFRQVKNLAADTGQIERVSDRNKTDGSGEPAVESDSINSASASVEVVQSHPQAVSSENRDLTANAEKTERISDTDEKASVMRPTVESDVSKTPAADLKYFRSHPDAVFHQAKNLEAGTDQIDKVSDRNETDRAGEPLVESGSIKSASASVEVDRKHPGVATLENRDLNETTGRVDEVSNRDETAVTESAAVDSDTLKPGSVDPVPVQNQPAAGFSENTNLATDSDGNDKVSNGRKRERLEKAAVASDVPKSEVGNLKRILKTDLKQPSSVSDAEKKGIVDSTKVEQDSEENSSPEETTGRLSVDKPGIVDTNKALASRSLIKKKPSIHDQHLKSSAQTAEGPAIHSADDKKKSGPVAEELKSSDVEQFTTHDRFNNSAKWEKIKFKGADHNGQTVNMVMLVLSSEFFWRFSGLSIINEEEQTIRITDHFASSSLKSVLRDSQGIVSVGTASEEGDLEPEEYRAALRADRLTTWVKRTQPQISDIYTLSLGQYQRLSSENSNKNHEPSSNDQRRVILISIIQRNLKANLAEAIKNGLSSIPELPYELRKFSHFRLKNHTSAY